MTIIIWLAGLLRRPGRLLGTMLGVALTVALLVALSGFIAASAATMTERAIADVPVDWQLQLAPGTDVQAILETVRTTTRTTTYESVGYADVSGFSAETGGTVQTTGAGKVLGISPEYRQRFPAELRLLIGSLDGVLVAQQTAANLHVTVGDAVTIQRMGLAPSSVRVDGVVDLPQADSLFQAVGLPSNAAPQAPPDNVLLLPAGEWHALFDPQATARPDSIHQQLHIQIAHDLPADPNAAFIAVQQQARNLEARIAGSGVIGDNLAARLDGVRADALYARVLFLFLGLPGALLAMIVTVAIAGTGATRRRREQALLRVRGATTARILRLAGMEAILVSLGGMALGLALAAVAACWAAPNISLLDQRSAVWTIGGLLVGGLLAVVAIVLPAWRHARHTTVAAARVVVGRASQPLWQRLYLDAFVLAGAALLFWRTANTGYQIVLAPEGVPQTAVAYESFLAPLGVWVGVALLALRIGRAGLARGRQPLTAALRPLTRELAGAVAATLSRQRMLLTREMVLVALAVAFATSTAIFNTTYNAQAHVDAELTNGADVQVSGSTTAPPADLLLTLLALPGVAAAQPMQHRFAYVGNDLQDLYGIDPTQIGQATTIANAYVAGGDAPATLAALAAQPDGVLVSEETVTDFQLTPGDQINLRLQNLRDLQYHVIPFRFVGVVREFPTAPRDSFLVANRSYIAQQTGSSASEIVLLRTVGDPAAVAARVQMVVSRLPGARVVDIGMAQRTISSSLTAVDLRGLTGLELAFAVLLVVGATGLVQALSLSERRRSFAILSALGARTNQLGAFVWSEGLLVLATGGVIGGALGVVLAQMLVWMLTGVFDPPPQALAVPWGELGLLVAAAAIAAAISFSGAHGVARRRLIETLREL